ncbi:glutathione peroxidase [Pseudorhodobacter antarcticus]|uniref:Glutathione peroxidase n=1 Tax=Pseudorhodobacter antarcticus TaxID=1077947 RepID=A0A1H8A9L0_9RHOB|nr:glutathione peroxidase [Pseudorhodobacter antarcticus]SEM66594.1 glutathione peroxidase [Pseudorhodobacter antarcticus]
MKASILALILSATTAVAAPPSVPFASIDGGDLSLTDYAGQPILLVNTASQCGFTPQFDALQSLYDQYKDQGLVVVAVPSDDFKQELNSAAEVKEFCEVNFNLTLPMTDITRVRGAQAHPVYGWLRDQAGFVPRWNFNKVLIDRNGAVVGTWDSAVKPDGPQITAAVKAALQ